jgi:hypothetical protein
MAPGDREWSVLKERQQRGVPVMRQLKIELDHLADALGVGRIAYTG